MNLVTKFKQWLNHRQQFNRRKDAEGRRAFEHAYSSTLLRLEASITDSELLRDLYSHRKDPFSKGIMKAVHTFEMRSLERGDPL